MGFDDFFLIVWKPDLGNVLQFSVEFQIGNFALAIVIEVIGAAIVVTKLPKLVAVIDLSRLSRDGFLISHRLDLADTPALLV